ncbi:MAG: VWA domain-containing protein [Alphaproteobacteria bacterium]|jgi:hypothetical protein|nr:VWA domain-containing protein [Alphaproteobacteria bacterium]
MADKRDRLPAPSSDSEIDAFLDTVGKLTTHAGGSRKGRLIFALDATASREQSWDTACHIQAEMFSETAALGTLAVQLAYYRGFGEFKATPFSNDSKALLQRMTGVRCLGGRTQIGKLLRHALKESAKEKVHAVVFIGDACEESVDELCHQAGQLGIDGVPVFVFHEGGDAVAESAFRQIARLSGGAYCRFDSASAASLKALLAAVAVYAVGGRPALEDFERREGRTLLRLESRRGKGGGA